MSAGLLFLTSEDFNIQKGNKGDILCSNIPGFSLILYYSTHCPHCQTLIPIFKKLPGTINGCQFGMINISTNRRVAEMSQTTIAPIKYVPFVVLYVNGKPFMIYKGPHDEGEIRKFVVEIANNIQKRQQFSRKEEAPQGGGSQGGNQEASNVPEKIPEYCLGKPICGNDKVCYLEFNTAYNKK